MTHQPAAGDLHRWDDLQDGCLYVDITRDGIDYAGCCEGRALWLAEHGEDANVWPVRAWSPARSLRDTHSPAAVVVATGLRGAADFHDAIETHRARNA